MRVRTTLVDAAVPAASCLGLALLVLLRLPGHGPAEAQSLPLSAAVVAALGCVPHGQWALLDADILIMIDRSACLVEPVLVSGAVVFLPVPTHQALPAPRPVAARECPHRRAESLSCLDEASAVSSTCSSAS